ncbi:MAG: alanine racemase [Anaerolineae bacterium]|nr:alanine racemase [Anaerolineae bacterium]MDQ7037148.1 alanine racemase [Anaerolineae bacterium]
MSEIGLAKEQLDTPTLWVDLDIMENNIATLAQHFEAANVQWRPHMKGVRIPGIAHKALMAGAIGVTCSTIKEAEVMAKAGITNILIANQVVGSRKLTRLVNLCKYADIKVIVDNEANVAELSAAVCARGVEVGVLIDMDTGMQRTGLLAGDAVVNLSQLVHETSGLNFLGMMAWEGHTLGHNDPEIKRQEIIKSVAQLTEMADRCRAAGLPVSIVSGGGSGTYKVTPFVKGMTEIQAGGAIFSDVAYQSWDVETTPSLFVQTIVSSRPAPDRIIFDAGFKTMPTWHAQPRAIGIEGVKSHIASAEHGIISLDKANNSVKVGDIFDFMVGYTDSTLFLYDKLYGIRDGVVEVVWDILV